MGADVIISIGIICLSGGSMIAVGVSNVKAVNPCGFYSGETPPGRDEIYDVKSYNLKHGLGWILYGIGMIILSFLGLLNQTVFCIALIVEILGGIVLLCLWHHYLFKTYSKG